MRYKLIASRHSIYPEDLSVGSSYSLFPRPLNLVAVEKNLHIYKIKYGSGRVKLG